MLFNIDDDVVVALSYIRRSCTSGAIFDCLRSALHIRVHALRPYVNPRIACVFHVDATILFMIYSAPGIVHPVNVSLCLFNELYANVVYEYIILRIAVARSLINYIRKRTRESVSTHNAKKKRL